MLRVFYIWLHRWQYPFPTTLDVFCINISQSAHILTCKFKLSKMVTYKSVHDFWRRNLEWRTIGQCTEMRIMEKYIYSQIKDVLDQINAEQACSFVSLNSRICIVVLLYNSLLNWWKLFEYFKKWKTLDIIEILMFRFRNSRMHGMLFCVVLFCNQISNFTLLLLWTLCTLYC